MIGSLHTMSYLKPSGFLNRMVARFKKTQKANIKEQYEKYNVRAFDFHIFFIGNEKRAILKYGVVEYKVFSIYEFLNYLDSKKNTYVRVVFDDVGLNLFKEKRKALEKRFFEYCYIISSIYENIKFFGGYRESDSRQIYKFHNDAPDNLIFYKRVEKLNKI